ncbi:MAG: 3-isopropylmalate dehydrogenase [Myxococcales bacterium]|nr:3-isopropylmalate dehydrogenase [Myxococcales bacterium]
MKASIVLLPGDGIGPEVVAEARLVLDVVANRFGHTLDLSEHLIGGVAIDREGTALPEATSKACADAHAVLLGAVGGPKWDNPEAKVRPEQGLLGIRKHMGLFANLRPVKARASLAKGSPLKEDRLMGVDFMILRELTGGLYFGQPRFTEKMDGGGERSVDTLEYTDGEIRRIVRLAFDIARGRRGHVTSVDKANVLETSRLWRRVTVEVHKQYPDVILAHQLVDSCAMRLVAGPSDFDVIVTENMFGDILSDEASVITGSLGLLPSASLGEGKQGLYEPVHGSAPDIAGQGLANPLATILSLAMLLHHSLELHEEAVAVEGAVEEVLKMGAVTSDLGGKLTTHEVGEAVRQALAS